MAGPCLAPWFNELHPAQAARVVAGLETVRLGGWLGIVRDADGQYQLRWQRLMIPMGRPGDTMLTAVHTFNNRLSRLVALRFRHDPAFARCVLVEAVEAFLIGDHDLCRGLLRRMLALTSGYAVAGLTASAHPKSVVRMLGPQGNPSAAALSRVILMLATRLDVRLEVTARRRPRSDVRLTPQGSRAQGVFGRDNDPAA